MKLPFSLFLAVRYLKPKRTFVSVITVLSVLGVALGIMCLIVVIAVMSGFDRELRQRLIGFEPHLRVSSAIGPIDDWEALQERLEKENPNFLGVSPYIMGPILLEFDNSFVGASLRGVQPNGELKLVDMRAFIQPGGTLRAGQRKVHHGPRTRPFARRRRSGTKSCSTAPATSPRSPRNSSASKKRTRTQKRSATSRPSSAPWNSRSSAFSRAAFISSTPAWSSPRSPSRRRSTILKMPSTASPSARRTPIGPSATAPRSQGKLGPEFAVSSWMDADRTRLDAVVQERVMMTFILMMIVVVAAFSISNTLITVIVQKKREIGVIKALGASPSQIVNIFVGQGFVVGIFGNAFGLLMAWAILTWRNEARQLIISVMHRDVFPAAVYQLTGIPSAITAKDVVVICTSAMVICVLAAYIPARFAAQARPGEGASRGVGDDYAGARPCGKDRDG